MIAQPDHKMNCLGKSQKKMSALVKFSSSYVGQCESFDRPCSKMDKVNSNLSSSWCWTADNHRVGQKWGKCKSTFQFHSEWMGEGILGYIAGIHHSSQWPSSLNTASSFCSRRKARSWLSSQEWSRNQYGASTIARQHLVGMPMSSASSKGTITAAGGLEDKSSS